MGDGLVDKWEKALQEEACVTVIGDTGADVISNGEPGHSDGGSPREKRMHLRNAPSL